MVGIAGGRNSEKVERVIQRMNNESWKEEEILGVGPWTVGVVTHGERDPTGCRIWYGGDGFAILFGTLRNEEELGDVINDFPQEMIDHPEETLSKVQGSFQVVAASDEALVVGTDLLASRPLYRFRSSGVPFASDLSSLAEEVHDPTVNASAIGELICYQTIQGRQTLFEDLVSIPSGSYMEQGSDSVDVKRYWSLDLGGTEKGVPDKVFDRYKIILGELAQSVGDEQEVGIWLSGGLDSRLLASELSRHLPDVRTFTYDANPGGGQNLRPAKKTAERLNLTNDLVTLRTEEFAESIEDGVNATGGSISFRHMHNLPFRVGEIGERIDVLFEVSGQGELFGEGIFPEDISEVKSGVKPASVFSTALETVSKERVNTLFTTDVDLNGEIDRMSEASPQNEPLAVLFDLYHQSFYPNFHYRTTISRFKVGLRNPISDKRLLELAASSPMKYRRHKKDRRFLGLVPEPVSKLKLELIKRSNRGIESIPYERTKAKPKRTMLVHSLSAILNRLPAFLKEKIGIKRQSTIYDDWYRNDSHFRRVMDSYLDDAKKRDFFDSFELKRLRTCHLNGEGNHVDTLAAVITAEIWLQNHL